MKNQQILNAIYQLNNNIDCLEECYGQDDSLMFSEVLDYLVSNLDIAYLSDFEILWLENEVKS